MRNACAAAGIYPPMPFHALRHTYASLAVQSGMALIKRSLGIWVTPTREWSRSITGICRTGICASRCSGMRRDSLDCGGVIERSDFSAAPL